MEFKSSSGIDTTPANLWLRTLYSNRVSPQVWQYEDGRHYFQVATDNLRPGDVTPEAIVRTFSNVGIPAVVENRKGANPSSPLSRKCVRIDAKALCLDLERVRNIVLPENLRSMEYVPLSAPASAAAPAAAPLPSDRSKPAQNGERSEPEADGTSNVYRPAQWAKRVASLASGAFPAADTPSAVNVVSLRRIGEKTKPEIER